jgi:16S rRNA (cytosine1402-N4)-methyltransferase
LIVLDQDADMLELAKPRLAGLPVTFVHASFADLPFALHQAGVERVHGVLADLGICSDQLDRAERGFSFSRSGPLDMRMNQTEGETASDLIHRLNERDLADLIYRYGEERHSRRIAKRIVERRRVESIKTTEELADIVHRCMARGPIDSATRTFQALRIAVNDELRALEKLLAALPEVLHPQGRAVLISFHSLEDRLVKEAFRKNETWEILTKKPIVASEEETQNNPRSRSAKLRAARRV